MAGSGDGHHPQGRVQSAEPRQHVTTTARTGSRLARKNGRRATGTRLPACPGPVKGTIGRPVLARKGSASARFAVRKAHPGRLRSGHCHRSKLMNCGANKQAIRLRQDDYVLPMNAGPPGTAASPWPGYSIHPQVELCQIFLKTFSAHHLDY